MNVNGEHNQLRHEQLYRFFPFTAFLVVSISILIWFLILKFTEAPALQRLAVLRLDESAKHELQLEKEQLTKEIWSNEIEISKLKRIRKACGLFNSLSEFPVRGGDHFVLFPSHLLNDGRSLLFFVPAGRHKLRFRLGEQNMVSRGNYASPINLPSPPGSDIERSEFDKSISKSLDLPAASVLQFTFRLENDDHNCLAIVELKDEHGVLFQESYKYQKRTLSGTFPGTGAGEDIFRPGQISRYSGEEWYRSEILKMSPNENSIHVLNFYYKIDSPESRTFLRANDVGSQLQKRGNYDVDFESRFEGDDGTGRLFAKQRRF